MTGSSMMFNLRDANASELSHNHQTSFLRAPHEGFEARRLFKDRYALIKGALERHPHQGVLILAFDKQEAPIGQVWMESSLDRTRALIIGRHSSAGLVIPGEYESISLRHLSVMVRATSHEDMNLRVVDLHSGLGFADEHGRALKSVTTDGSVFLALGSVRLVILQTTPSPILPKDAATAYAAIPERIFIDECAFVPRARSLLPVGESTMVRSQLGPLSATGRLLEHGELPFMRLSLSGEEMTVTRDVGVRALERGILIGRYSRCDVRTGQDSAAVSRVHMMLTCDGTNVLAVDAGSMNGTWIEGRAIRAAPILSGQEVRLGSARDLVLRAERL